jgi:hypothetical protein
LQEGKRPRSCIRAADGSHRIENEAARIPGFVQDPLLLVLPQALDAQQLIIFASQRRQGEVGARAETVVIIPTFHDRRVLNRVGVGVSMDWTSFVSKTQKKKTSKFARTKKRRHVAILQRPALVGDPRVSCVGTNDRGDVILE